MEITTLFRRFILFLVGIIISPFAHSVVIKGIAYRIIDNEAIVVAHDGYKGVVEIPDTVICRGKPYPVVGIGDRAFYNCDRIYSVFMPDSLRFIGEAAFAHCDSIISITVPNLVEEIPDSAFAYCPNLEVTILGRGVTRIGHGALWHAGDELLCNPRLVMLSDLPPEVDAELVDYMLLDAPFYYILMMCDPDLISGTNWQKYNDYGKCKGRSPFDEDSALGYMGYVYPVDRDYLENTDGATMFRYTYFENNDFITTDWMDYSEYVSNKSYKKWMCVEVMPVEDNHVFDVSTLVRSEYFASICTNNHAFGKAKVPCNYAESKRLGGDKFSGARHYYMASGIQDTAKFIVIYKKHFHVMHDIYSENNPSENIHFEPLYYNYQAGWPPNYCYRILTEIKENDTVRIPVGKRIEIWHQYPSVDCSGRIDNHEVLDGWFPHEISGQYARICAISGTKSGIAHIYLYHLSGRLPVRTITVIVGDGESGVQQVGSSTPWGSIGGAGSLTLQGLNTGVRVEIYNLQGMPVKGFIAADEQVTIDGLLPGIYITRHQMTTTKTLVY